MNDQSTKAGFTVGEWCRLTTISRAALYRLPDDQQPRSIKLGRHRVIVENPAAYLLRLAAAQEATQ